MNDFMDELIAFDVEVYNAFNELETLRNERAELIGNAKQYSDKDLPKEIEMAMKANIVKYKVLSTRTGILRSQANSLKLKADEINR